VAEEIHDSRFVGGVTLLRARSVEWRIAPSGGRTRPEPASDASPYEPRYPRIADHHAHGRSHPRYRSPPVTDRANADVELIERYLRGDVEAFDELMRAHEDRIFAVCLRMLRDREAALDATQETFVTVFRKADRFAGRSAFSTWLYRVAVNTCYDQARRRKRHDTAPLPNASDPADASADDGFRSAEVRPEIEAALAALPDEFRAAVVLSDVEGLALQTVADILEVPVGTVKSRVFRGRRLLAESLGNLVDPSDPPIREANA
jgi:RNA polymerase sigma-70 factor (ECF subfamily)